MANKEYTKKNEHEKLLSGYMEIWIAYVLKTYSSPEKPLSKKEVADKVSRLIGLGTESDSSDTDNAIERTVGRRLDELEMMGNLFDGSAKNTPVAESFYRVMGGRVKSVSGRPIKFYFESILEPGEVSMICAAIESNHYLSADEKQYLVQRECAALSYRDDEPYSPVDKKKEGIFSRLPRKPHARDEENLPPSRASITLKKIAILQYAIRKHLKIKVIPGTYTTGNKKILFVPKSDTESILNPYAFVSQNGQYYIIVTHEGYDNPTHYRVDRLYSVELCKNDDGGKTGYKKRDEIPMRLQKFFSKGGKFKADEYTALYPLMAYYGDSGIKQCRFLCYKDAITVAIDHFGVGDGVTVESADDSDYCLFTVFADYDNVKRFCIQQYAIVKPVYPQELVDETKEAHRRSIETIETQVDSN